VGRKKTDLYPMPKKAEEQGWQDTEKSQKSGGKQGQKKNNKPQKLSW